MWTIILIAAVVIGGLALFLILRKRGQTPEVSPTPSPSSAPSITPTPSVTPVPDATTTLRVYNSNANSRAISSIRVDGKLVEGDEFPVIPGENKTFVTDQVGVQLDINVRLLGKPYPGVDSLSIHTGEYTNCFNGPAGIIDFQDVPVNGTDIYIDYDEIGC